MAGFQTDEYLEIDAPEGFEFTGEYRRPRAGEFFLFESIDGERVGALQQTATREEGHADPGDGLGYVSARRRILRPTLPPVLSVSPAPGRPDDQYPISVRHNGGHLTRLTIEEARELAGDLREEASAAEERRDGPFVQVRIGAGSWTYRDPSGSLQVDDLVEVPFGNWNRTRPGTVVGLGRGNTSGPTKAVAARLRREEL